MKGFFLLLNSTLLLKNCLSKKKPSGPGSPAGPPGPPGPLGKSVVVGTFLRIIDQITFMFCIAYLPISNR